MQPEDRNFRSPFGLCLPERWDAMISVKRGEFKSPTNLSWFWWVTYQDPFRRIAIRRNLKCPVPPFLSGQF